MYADEPEHDEKNDRDDNNDSYHNIYKCCVKIEKKRKPHVLPGNYDEGVRLRTLVKSTVMSAMPSVPAWAQGEMP